MRYSMGFASEIALRKVLATQNGRDAAQPKKVSSFESCINTPLSPHRGSIAPGAGALLYLGSSANCYSSRQHSRRA